MIFGTHDNCHDDGSLLYAVVDTPLTCLCFVFCLTYLEHMCNVLLLPSRTRISGTRLSGIRTRSGLGLAPVVVYLDDTAFYGVVCRFKPQTFSLAI